MLVVGEEASPDGFRQWLAKFFYADNGLLTSSRLAWLQASPDVLLELSNRVGLHTNINKMVGMVC